MPRFQVKSQTSKVKTYHLSPSGFTIVEVLIVVTILALLAAILLFSDLTGSLKKARDSKRKQDLAKMTRILDDYYNDRQSYPPMNTPPDGNMSGAPWGGKFDQYAAQLPRDPAYPSLWYYYQSGPTGNFFVIYAKLENTGDPDITLVGCQYGCGPKDQNDRRLYNYFVSSTDVRMLSGIPNGYDPGYDINVGSITPPPTGGGAFTPTPTSPSQPTATGVPAPTASPTPFPPTPTSQPGACAVGSCCYAMMCGDLTPYPAGSGMSCNSSRLRCSYDQINGHFTCAFDNNCP